MVLEVVFLQREHDLGSFLEPKGPLVNLKVTSPGQRRSTLGRRVLPKTGSGSPLAGMEPVLEERLDRHASQAKLIRPEFAIAP